MIAGQPKYPAPKWFRWKQVEPLLRDVLPHVDLDAVTLIQCASVGFLIVSGDAPLGFLEAPTGEPVFTSELPVRLLVNCFGFGALSLLREAS